MNIYKKDFSQRHKVHKGHGAVNRGEDFELLSLKTICVLRAFVYSVRGFLLGYFS